MTTSKPKGKLIVLEGVDASGKQTQTTRLYDRLLGEGYPVKIVSYPRYDKASSCMIKSYLAGDFGTDPQDISPYIASTFYAADRYASYKEDYEIFYKNGGIVIADRYTTSNMVHQASKIMDITERNAYLNWLYDYEFHLLGLPKPDLVFFLNIPPEISAALIARRANKINGEATKDIHEKSTNHLINAHDAGLFLVEKYQWTKINCCVGANLKSVKDIHEEIYQKVEKVIEGMKDA